MFFRKLRHAAEHLRTKIKSVESALSKLTKTVNSHQKKFDKIADRGPLSNQDLHKLLSLTKPDGAPTDNHLRLVLQDLHSIKLNLKANGYHLGARLAREVLAKVNFSAEPKPRNLPSKPTTQSDVESPWFAYWCHQIQSAPLYHRKLWEFAYVLQALWEEKMLRPGTRALGFGCGTEPLPSYFASKGIQVVATDLAPEQSEGLGWTTTNQHTTSLEAIHIPALCEREAFLKNTTLEYVDMNVIPATLQGGFDFVWSICALEHLGSIEHGLRFIEESIKCLKPGGIALHTTEFNYLYENETISKGGTVLFLRQHFEQIAQRLRTSGCEITLDFDIGSGVLDRFIDLPPYALQDSGLQPETFGTDLGKAHLKMTINGIPSTCFALRIKTPLS